MLALEFPPINELIRWQDIFPAFNKVGAHRRARRRDRHRRVPLGRPQGSAEGARPACATSPRAASTFIENDIVMQTMGKDGLPWTPFLLSLFIFVYLCNVPGIIPFFQMPATARMAIPLFLALLVWVIYNVVGFKHNGHQVHHPHDLAARACRSAMTPLVGVIEVLSNIVLRPFSLAVRLFANMLAGHMLLVTFAFLTNALFFAETSKLVLRADGILPFFMLRLPDRVRGAGRPAAGLHLHDPHRRLHRRRSAPRALTTTIVHTISHTNLTRRN